MNSLARDAVPFLEEEAIRTDGYTDDAPGVHTALQQLQTDFSSSFIDQSLLSDAQSKSEVRVTTKLARYDETVASIVELASQPTTHVCYLLSSRTEG